MHCRKWRGLVCWIGAAGCIVGWSSGCGGKSGAPSRISTPVAPTPTVTAISISGSMPEIGATTQLTVTATLSDGNKEDVTAKAAWQTSNAAVITISESGVARGVGAGEADITASYGGSTSSQHVRLDFRTFTLAGVVTDDATGRPVAGSEIEILDGKNAGKRSPLSDGNGYYSMPGLLADTFGIRARAYGYDFADRTVTIADGDARADVRLRPTPRSGGTGPGCAVTVTPMILSFSKGGVPSTGGGAASLSIGTAQGCAWSAMADADWILLSQNGVFARTVSGSGAAAVKVGVLFNVGVSRTATVKIRWATGGADVAVNQPGVSTCVASLAPDHQNFAAGGGSGSIGVTAPPDCSWKAFAFPAFVAITGRPTGTGNGTVTFTVAPNTSGAVRSGEIDLSEPWDGSTRRTFTLTQAGSQ